MADKRTGHRFASIPTSGTPHITGVAWMHSECNKIFLLFLTKDIMCVPMFKIPTSAHAQGQALITLTRNNFFLIPNPNLLSFSLNPVPPCTTTLTPQLSLQQQRTARHGSGNPRALLQPLACQEGSMNKREYRNAFLEAFLNP